MAFRRSDLQEAFFVPGTHAFRVLGYGTADPLEEVLGPGYFAAAGALLQPGDLVYVRARAADAGREAGVPAAAVHMALLMVRSGAPGSVNVRLVQDCGRSDEPEAVDQRASALPATVTTEAPPLKRGRGRPPGSRSKKNGVMAAQLN
jgi:hypothetical protein